MGKQLVYEMLATGECKLAREMAVASGISERSVRRFVKELREDGHRIVASKGRGGGIMLRARKEKANDQDGQADHQA
jgi:predicted DNA-binding transcriptional regulator YafY